MSERTAIESDETSKEPASCPRLRKNRELVDDEQRSADDEHASRKSIARILKATFVMPAPVVALCPAAIAALMAWVFLSGSKESSLSYVAYAASAWCLAVLVVGIVHGRPARAAIKLARRSKRIAKAIDDKEYRAALGVKAGLAIDSLWAVGNLAYGALSVSAWLITLGAYYLILAMMRMILMRDIRAGDEARTASTARACGILICLLALVVSGFVTLTTHDMGSFSYPDIVIYAIAAYAFFSLGSSIAGIVSRRKRERQTLFIVSSVNLASALVSILALEVAMLALFGEGDDSLFVLLMNALTGAGVAAANIAIGASLVKRARRIKSLS